MIRTNLGINFWVEEFDNNLYGLMNSENNQAFRITKFDLKYCNEGDFEMGHFYSYQHPCAVFVNNLVLSCIKEETTYSLRNNTYLKIQKDNVENIKIKDATEFYEILKTDFNCSFTLNESTKLYDEYIKS